MLARSLKLRLVNDELVDLLKTLRGLLGAVDLVLDVEEQVPQSLDVVASDLEARGMNLAEDLGLPGHDMVDTTVLTVFGRDLQPLVAIAKPNAGPEVLVFLIAADQELLLVGIDGKVEELDFGRHVCVGY